MPQAQAAGATGTAQEGMHAKTSPQRRPKEVPSHEDARISHRLRDGVFQSIAQQTFLHGSEQSGAGVLADDRGGRMRQSPFR